MQQCTFTPTLLVLKRNLVISRFCGLTLCVFFSKVVISSTHVLWQYRVTQSKVWKKNFELPISGTHGSDQRSNLDYGNLLMNQCWIQTYMAQMARMSQFGELPDKNGTFPPNFLRKSQKSPIFDQKCSCLVTLRSGSTEIKFQPELPELYIFHQKMAILAFSQKISSNIHKNIW